MSDAATPAPSAAPSAAPAAEGGKPALSLVKDDDKANSLDVSAAAKALRNARKRGQAREQKAAEAKRAQAPVVEPSNAIEEATASAPEHAPEEQRTPWAHKVKADLEASTKKIAEFKKIAKAGHSENRELRSQIEDLTSDAEHYKGLFERLVAGLKGQGFEVDPLEMQLAERDRELGRFKRRGDRESKASKDAQVSSLAGSIKQRVDAMVTKYPELNPRTSKEAADYLRFWMTSERFSLDTLERDLESFARHLRAQMGAKATPPAIPAGARAPRPQSSTLSGAPAVAVTSKPTGPGFRTDKDIKADFLRRKATRQAGA